MDYSCFYLVKIICFLLFILIGGTSSQNTKCPFQYLFDLGDGVTDIGNSIRILPFGPSLPAAHLPYGKTFPGRPTGRWSDGLIDIDYADVGVPTAPYLSRNATTSNGIMFSVARRPVLNISFFESRGVKVPPAVVPLSGQLRWLKAHLESICSTPADCTNILEKSLIVVGDTESNDIGYALSQGKSIQEVQNYVPFITREFVNVARELIKMGATRMLLVSSGPLGCYPYILTALQSNDPTAYDNQGCLKTVNDLIVFKNNNLQKAINNLRMEFPKRNIAQLSYYEVVQTIIGQAPITDRGNTSLKACCGIGGRYNYDSKRFCGSPGVSVCANPNEYIYWDGLHFTQEAYKRILQILRPQLYAGLNCTS